jgi:hypothetical protein
VLQNSQVRIKAQTSEGQNLQATGGGVCVHGHVGGALCLGVFVQLHHGEITLKAHQMLAAINQYGGASDGLVF